MSVAAEVEPKPFVLLPVGSRRLALGAETVIELIAPGKVQSFPHQTPWIDGVIVRRGRVVPVCNVGRLLGESAVRLDRFYLVAEWRASGVRDWCAIPVTGECELRNAPAILDREAGDHPAYFPGSLATDEGPVEILDLGALLLAQLLASENTAAGPKP